MTHKVAGLPICVWCKHFDVPNFDVWLDRHQSRYKCTAFPDDIPHEIVYWMYDHSHPYPGDQGITFEVREDGERVPRTAHSPYLTNEEMVYPKLQKLKRDRRHGVALPPLTPEEAEEPEEDFYKLVAKRRALEARRRRKHLVARPFKRIMKYLKLGRE